VGVLLTALFAISTGSLVLSYLVWPGRAWHNEFGLLYYYATVPTYIPREILGVPGGFVVELIRGALIVWIAGWLLGHIYLDESRLLLGAARGRVSDRTVRITLGVVAVTVAFALTMIIRHHMRSGPDDLMRHYLRHGAIEHGEEWELLRRPYLLYLPYSIVNYVLIGIPVFAIGLYAVSSDTRVTKRDHDALVQGIASAPDCSAIDKIFRDYFNGSLDRCERYAWFSLCLAIVVAYEHHVGSYALTETATLWAWVGWIVVSVYFLTVLGIALFYENGFRASVRRLSNLHCDIRDFQKECSVLSFLTHLMRRYLWLNVALVLFGVLPLIAKFRPD